MKPKVTITAKNKGKEIERLLNMEGTDAVKVGVLKGSGVHPGPRGKKPKVLTATIAEIAWWNEFGTRTIPERPFLRWTMREHNFYREHLKKALFKAMTTPRTYPVKWLKKVGQQAASDVRSMIRDGPFEPNAPATIKKKSTSSGRKAKPLIDTGTLRQSIQYEVDKGLGV